MNETPDVSVVMSVYNGAATLAATVDSVLAQEGVDFEFIVVNDGSTDGGGAILDDYARRDDRMRVVHQENTGLTRALIRGCAEARGKYIARQDAGDFSLPGRLARQFTLLESNSDVVMASCGTRFVGPEGEFLYEIVQQGDELQRGLEQLRIDQIRGPSHHGSTMFHRTAYQTVGGYRPQFQVAQDLDLWIRLVEVGRCVATPDIFYKAQWQSGSISHLRRRQQVLAAQVIFECRNRRRRGESERPVLDRLVASLTEQRSRWQSPPGLIEARFYYFLGSILVRRDPKVARYYLRKAVEYWPWHIKAWIKLTRFFARLDN